MPDRRASSRLQRSPGRTPGIDGKGLIRIPTRGGLQRSPGRTPGIDSTLASRPPANQLRSLQRSPGRTPGIDEAFDGGSQSACIASTEPRENPGNRREDHERRGLGDRVASTEPRENPGNRPAACPSRRATTCCFNGAQGEPRESTRGLGLPGDRRGASTEPRENPGNRH